MGKTSQKGDKDRSELVFSSPLLDLLLTLALCSVRCGPVARSLPHLSDSMIHITVTEMEGVLAFLGSASGYKLTIVSLACVGANAVLSDIMTTFSRHTIDTFSAGFHG